ncbi:extracellular solute-binding protein [Microbacterium gorillae]|uniref:extracellular solute-binding protein n=1 Tax=Microbacterium gorillae TaxID=1231063 RepID=UPI0005901AFF|nr:extracellular solute-binding protein [Microbacterium gorillae]
MFTTRRAITTVVGAALVALTVSACSSDASQAGTESADFVYFAAGAYTEEYEQLIDRSLFSTYTEQTGGQVTIQKGDCGINALAQQVEANNVTASVFVFCSTAEKAMAAEQGLLQKIDPKVVPTNLVEDDHVDEYGIDFGAWTMGLAYDGDVYPTAPTSIGDFFDTDKFPGKRCVSNFPMYAGVFEAALLHDGVAAADIYPLDLDRAYAQLDRIKDDILFFANTAEGGQNLLTKQCGLLLTSAGDTKIMQAQNPDRNIQFVQKDGVDAYAAIGIPKGAPNPTAANAYLKSIIENRDGLKKMLIGVAGPAVLLKDPIPVPDELKDWSGVLTGDGFFPMDERWYMDNLGEISERWNTWLVG